MNDYSPRQILNLLAFGYIHQIEQQYILQTPFDIIQIIIQLLTEFDEEFYDYLEQESSIKRICDNFRIHYNRMNKSYVYLFSSFCYDNNI